MTKTQRRSRHALLNARNRELRALGSKRSTISNLAGALAIGLVWNRELAKERATGYAHTQRFWLSC